jgi:trans-aconitate 3-methyltransferase
VLAYHHGPRLLALDLGCGTGIVTRQLAKHFDFVIGTDPSPNMIKQAQSSIQGHQRYGNVTFHEGSAERTPSLEDDQVDLIVAGQAAHWFDYARLWPEMKRLVRPGGTLAFWGYSDPVFVDFPRASSVLRNYLYDDRPGKLGAYWSMPGRSYTQNKLRVIQPLSSDWEDVQRVEYEPGTSGKGSGEGTLFMERRLTVGEMKGYMRTFSNFHEWQKAHPEQKAVAVGGPGDAIDEMFEEAASKDAEFGIESEMINLEWGSGLVMARRRA